MKLNQNLPYLLFLAVALAVCLVPSVGTLVAPTTETTENRAMSPAPTLLTEDGAVNPEVFAEFDSWFTDHMALRNQLVYADTMIQTTVFSTSSVSSVVYGTDGWLYYAATLDDFLGTAPMSERELFNLARNFSLVQEWLEARGITFLLTIPPNKNTLYPAYMPANYQASEDPHNAERLAAYLDAAGVHYLDLFALFGAQDAELYLKTDSHWNGTGAVLVYEAVMAELVADSVTLSGRTPTTVAVTGDLGRMLYSLYGSTETDYAYGVATAYTFSKDGATVEDGFLRAQASGAANGSLLMFRDSFANSLIPLMANCFDESVWAKGQPNALERYVTAYAPEYVVIEQVERNIAQYLNEPPIIAALEATPAELTATMRLRAADVTIEPCENDITFVTVSGEITDGAPATEALIYVSVNGTLYRAYQTGEAGFVVFLRAADVTPETAQVFIFATE